MVKNNYPNLFRPIQIGPMKLKNRIAFEVIENWEQLPDGYQHLDVDGVAVDSRDRVYLLTDQGLGRTEGPASITWPSGGVPVTAAIEDGNTLFTGSEDFISFYPALDDGVPDRSMYLGMGPVAGLVADVSLPRQLDLVVVSAEGIAGIFAQDLVDVEEFAAGRVPLDQPRAAVRASDGGFVVATRGGAYRIMERGIGLPCGQTLGWPRNEQTESVTAGLRMCSIRQAVRPTECSSATSSTVENSSSASRWRRTTCSASRLPDSVRRAPPPSRTA